MPEHADRGIEELLVEVNEVIREIAAKHVVSAGEHWDFLCECSIRGCLEPVSLTLAEYAALRAEGESVLARDYRPARLAMGPAAAPARAA